MKLQQLEYICAIVEEGSISGASRRLHVAQPPISRQVALLEEELGIQLFVRQNHGVMLTQAGQKFYQESRRLLQGIDHMVSGIKSLDEGVTGTLQIGLLYSIAPYALPRIMKFHKQYPLVELKISIDTFQGLMRRLQRGDIHLLFTRMDAAEAAGFSTRMIGEDPLELLMTKELDPAPELDEIPIDALREVSFCQLQTDDDWSYSSYLTDECQRHGFLPKVAVQCFSSHIAVQMVLAGFGVSFLPRSIADTVPGSGIYSKPIRDLHPVSPSMLVWNENTYMPPCGRIFLQME